MAVVTNIADAVVSELQTGTFSMSFTPRRLYVPKFELTDAALRVSVVPKAVDIERLNRSNNQEDFSIDVAVQKKLKTAANTEIDALVELTGEIADFLRHKRLAAFPCAIWIRTQNAPIYAPDHLEEWRQFTSLLTFTYRVVR